MSLQFCLRMAKLIISSLPQPVVKPVLIMGGNVGQQVSEISGVTRTDRVYNLEDLVNAEERKREGKDVLAEEPHRKKMVSEDETMEFIMTFKSSETR